METSRLEIVDSVPWREAYPEYSEGELSGKALAGTRYREGNGKAIGKSAEYQLQSFL
ncbi:MAG: hypothetical protein L7F78_13180 [Syntrophales bacterium LBB04]|nr:hypothetical protein [Syntrophales bacterium LBB04]